MGHTTTVTGMLDIRPVITPAEVGAHSGGYHSPDPMAEGPYIKLRPSGEGYAVDMHGIGRWADGDADDLAVAVEHLIYPYLTAPDGTRRTFAGTMHCEGEDGDASDLTVLPYGSVMATRYTQAPDQPAVLTSTSPTADAQAALGRYAEEIEKANESNAVKGMHHATAAGAHATAALVNLGLAGFDQVDDANAQRVDIATHLDTIGAHLAAISGELLEANSLAARSWWRRFLGVSPRLP
jgi:hypothetical protein